ncbi:MBL fold metallo-hydrolase RNA specificity domain-containing protein [Shinella sp.]
MRRLFACPPRKVFIVHGEPGAAEALRIPIDRELGWPAVVPRLDQKLEL